MAAPPASQCSIKNTSSKPPPSPRCQGPEVSPLPTWTTSGKSWAILMHKNPEEARALRDVPSDRAER
eukprot:CAMPEP_0197425266 /NCGR_PEP_ID=MMETSP1170-20131217/29897_1 /TAXON_ID=54406 /ORGANISM="Sarcinochrysis sp, Strain CCMP770" /LENGTH=66 /DNA_ID=CAMNT_0042952807 /DNA_START=355 /DNA_END=555 /DNA_ORIENTATION=-